MIAPRVSRRAPLLACAAVAVLALTACTAGGDAAPSASASASASVAPVPSPAVTSTPTATSTPTGAAPTPSGSAGAATQRYLGFVQQFSPGLAALKPEVLVQLGQQVCTDFGRGRDAGQVAVALGASTAAPDLQATDAAVIIGAAVSTLCPRYRAKLQD